MISGVPSNIAPLPGLPSVTPPAASDKGFGSVFSDAVARVESFGQNADQSVQRFLSGEGEELHEVALKSQQAELSFELFMQVRNKLISAYQEVMRMQV